MSIYTLVHVYETGQNALLLNAKYKVSHITFNLHFLQSTGSGIEDSVLIFLENGKVGTEVKSRYYDCGTSLQAGWSQIGLHVQWDISPMIVECYVTSTENIGYSKTKASVLNTTKFDSDTSTIGARRYLNNTYDALTGMIYSLKITDESFKIARSSLKSNIMSKNNHIYRGKSK